MKENSKSIGEKSEGMVLSRFLQMGWVVLMPFGDNQRYDFVIDKGFGFEKIQVKTGRLKDGCIKFPACSSSVHRKNGVRKNYIGEVDFFAVYCPETKSCYLLPVGSLTNKGTLRVENSKNGQKKKVVLAKDYLI